MERTCFGMPHQSEQVGSSGDRPPGSGKNRVEPFRLMLQAFACTLGPSIVQQRSAADRERGSRAGPWPKCGFDRLSDLWRSHRESEAESCQTEELSERSENDHRQVAAQRNSVHPWVDIGKGFIDHQPAAAIPHLACDPRERGSIHDSAIRIVRIDNHDVTHAIRQHFDAVKRCNVVPGIFPSERVFAVGGSRDSHGTRCGEPWQPLDQGLRTRPDSDVGIVGDFVSDTRGIDQRGFIGKGRQPGPDRIRQRGNGPRPGIDPGRKVEPRIRRTAVMRDCPGQVAAVFHRLVMPLSLGKCERLCGGFAALVMAFAFGIIAHARAADLPRVASINLCTDQLLMKLADPAQILGLSPYSRDAVRSWAATAAKKYRRLSGEAEDVLILKPDIVVAGRYTKRATRQLLKRQGQRVVEFDIAKSIDDVRAQLRKMGALVQHPDRAEAEIARLDAAIARAKQAVSSKPYRVLAVSRRGWVSGDDSVTSALLSIVGLSNAASSLAGIKHGGFAKLETIVALRPDFILLSDGSNVAEDEGRALLLHPALEKLYPPSRRIVIPEDLTVCGGPALPDALDRLVAELKRVGG